ncbi:MAG TPA: heavy-metal-associated domain-containing protein [Kaistia sp.]|nr:heavy-metal-associated domain-containing protein [Kaistia sp.]
MQFHIKNMSCGGCARSVTKAIQGVDAQAKVTIDPNRHCCADTDRLDAIVDAEE